MMELFAETLVVLGQAFGRLENKIAKPGRVSIGNDFIFRYSAEDQTVEVASVQKLARVVSGIHACYVLLASGLEQELGTIWRTLDEFCEDIWFLCMAMQTGQLTPLHTAYLDAHFQVILKEHSWLDNRNEPTVPRKKIRAALSKMPEAQLNTSDAQSIYQSLHKANSGFVHGASDHILTMYGGNPARYYVAGLRDSTRIKSMEDGCFNYFYRGLLTHMFVGKVFGDRPLVDVLYKFQGKFERESGRNDWEDPEPLWRKIKKKAKNAKQEEDSGPKDREK